MEQAEVHEPAHVLDETHVLAWLMPMASASFLYTPLHGPHTFKSRSSTHSRILHLAPSRTTSPNTTPPLSPSPSRI